MVAEGRQIEGAFYESEIGPVYQFPDSDSYFRYRGFGGDVLSSTFEQYDRDGYYIGVTVTTGNLSSLREVSTRPGFLKREKRPDPGVVDSFRKWIRETVGF